MKTLKAIVAASVLAFSLSIPAYANTNPGDVHVPGKPNPITGTPPAQDACPADGATAVDGDLSFSALTDILWALASIF